MMMRMNVSMPIAASRWLIQCLSHVSVSITVKQKRISMIKKSKNNEAMPDFDDMMNEVNHDMERQDLEQDIIDRVPELKQLSEDIEKATTAVINAKLTLESAIQETRRVENELTNAIKELKSKVDTINDHLDNAINDAPTKLHVSVSATDSDKQKIQEMFNKEHEWVIAKMQSHLKVVNSMLLEERRKAMNRFKEYDGCYLSSRVQWFVWAFFIIGIVFTTTVVVLSVIKYCG